MPGRPKGAKNKATMDRDAAIRESIAMAQAAGVDGHEKPTPEQIAKMSVIEIMLYASVQQAIIGDWVMAADIAAKVAPFRHAKLSQVKTETTVRRGVAELSDDELEAIAFDVDSVSQIESEG